MIQGDRSDLMAALKVCEHAQCMQLLAGCRQLILQFRRCFTWQGCHA